MATPRIPPLPENLPPVWQPGDLILNTYEVRQVYTNGGMALVYRVFHRGWGIDLAVKCPRPEIATLEDAAENIVSEAEAWVNLGLYPHIVSCYYIRVLEGIPYIFMEYVDGGSLSEAIEQGRLYTGTPDEVMRRILDLCIQIAWGMDYAHQQGVVHQDIKPANVLINRDGIAKLTDFGMAQARARMKPAASRDAFSPANPDDQTILVETAGMTPAYCSPEQAGLKSLTRRTDVWSWGITVLEMFLGRRTWKSGQYIQDYLNDYLKSGPLVSAIPLMPGKMAQLLRQCFSVEPDARPRDGKSLADAVIAFYEHEVGTHYPRKQPRLDTMLADSLNNRAVSLLDLGREDDALQYFDDALKAQSSHFAALYNRSIHLWRAGRMTDTEAIQVLQEAHRNQPDSWEPAYLTSLLHLERNDAIEAARLAEAAVLKYGDLPALVNVTSITRRQMQLNAGCLKVIEPQAGTLNTVAINRQGNLLATAGGDPAVQIWDAASGTKIRELTGHTDIVRSIKISQDGSELLTACLDQTLRLWNISTGECLQVLSGHSDYIQDAAFLPGQRKAVSASTDGRLGLWDLATGEPLHWLEGHADSVHTVAVMPNGRVAVSSAYDNTLRLWDLLNGTCLKVIPWVRSCTSNICLSSDGRRVLFGAGDNRLWLLDLESGQPVLSYTGHNGPVNHVQIAPNGVWALSAGMDRTLRLWDLTSGRCLRTFSGHASAVNAVDICATKALAVSASSDQTLRLWRLSSGAKAPYITVHPQSTRDVLEISSQLESTIHAVEEKLAAQEYPGAMQILVEARDKPEYQQNPRLMELWERVGRKGRRSRLRATWLSLSLKPHTATVNTAALSPETGMVVTGSDDGSLAVWNLANSECQQRLDAHQAGTLSVAFLPGGQRFISTGRDGAARVWQLGQPEPVLELRGHTSAVNCVSIAPDGESVLTGSNDNTLRLWSLADGSCLRVFKGHEHYVTCGLISLDGETAVSASWDHTVRVWDLESGLCRYALAGHTEIVQALALAPDGLSAASSGQDGTIHLWDLAQGSIKFVIEQPGGKTSALVFSVDGQFLFSGDERGVLTIWDAASLAPVRSLKAHTAPITALVPARSGNLLASVSIDQTLRIWQLDWDYAFPQTVIDETLLAYLRSFIRHTAVEEPVEVGKTGRIPYTDKQVAELMGELECRGYGGLSMAELNTALHQASKS